MTSSIDHRRRLLDTLAALISAGGCRKLIPRPLVLLFLALGLPLGLSMAVLVPLGQVADEPAHVLKADSLLHGELIGRRRIVADINGRQRPAEGVVADGALLEVILLPPRPNDPTPTRIDGATFDRSHQTRFGHTGFYELGAIAGYFPIFYLPAASALGLCKLLGAGAHAGFLAARLANLFVSLLMQATALAIARRGRVLLFAALLLPLSLSLDASVNQDGLLISAAALAAACATTMRGRDPSSSPAWWMMATLVACIVLAKPPYVPLAALLLLPSTSSRSGRLPTEPGLRVAVLAIILLLSAGWIWLTVHVAAAPVFRGPEEAGPLWPGSRPAIFDGTDMAAQVSVLAAHPSRVLTLPLRTIWNHPEVFPQMLSLLGWLNFRLPSVLVSGWTVALLCAALADMVGQPGAGRDRSRGWDAMLLLSAMLATLLLIYQSQYLSFTPVGWSWVSGVQGRYLLPLLPLLALALPSWNGGTVLSRGLGVPAVLVAAAGCCMIPVLVLRFYYMG